ncbi:hypothetical protein Ade02nite_40740 [Paractinoplanes deccanensis]|uniref:DUF3302 domain-containing protein n=1 Tax=Paractinoplanes deccanensis TaxID=113561 RepID=A0ABQ3Y629_9ACTN|nr:hypothetical protein [Actinoplanes deccanensis]GID75433.1 hypothetical protein Ade02nite_40740 [Actinoplanes deccanensis]
MEFALGIAYFIGIFIAMVVTRHRAGVGQGRIKVFGRDGFGLGWVLGNAFACLFWPVTLVIWLSRGRPEPRVVFNERARERKAAQQI